MHFSFLFAWGAKAKLYPAREYFPFIPRDRGSQSPRQVIEKPPWVTTGSDCNIVLYPAQWHPYSKYRVA